MGLVLLESCFNCFVYIHIPITFSVLDTYLNSLALALAEHLLLHIWLFPESTPKTIQFISCNVCLLYVLYCAILLPRDQGLWGLQQTHLEIEALGLVFF